MILWIFAIEFRLSCKLFSVALGMRIWVVLLLLVMPVARVIILLLPVLVVEMLLLLLLTKGIDWWLVHIDAITSAWRSSCR